MNHHAFVIEAETEEGIATAQAWVEKELGVKIEKNPDVAVLRYGLFSVADARKVTELASGAAFVGENKVVIISASRAYHEAQNALLKVFEEPPAGTYLFLILPSLGGLLPTLRSRVVELKLNANEGFTKSLIPEVAETFLKATKEKRTVLIKKLASGKSDEERRENRDEVIAIVNGVEAAIYSCGSQASAEHSCGHPISTENAAILSDIATLRTYLYDRSAPVRMILEHLSLVTPRTLGTQLGIKNYELRIWYTEPELP